MSVELDAVMLAEAKSGNEAAFEKLVFALEKVIYFYLYKFVGHKETAEDLTQETFLKIYQNLRWMDIDKGNPRAWMFQIATNLARDWYRQTKGRKEVWIDTDVESGVTLPDTHEQVGDRIDREFHTLEMQDAIQQLKPAYRAVIMLHYYEDAKYEEIAESLSLPLNTIKTQVRRAKIDLQKILAKKYGQRNDIA